ncbi:MAG: hypothetical protein KGI00_05095 [Candidatus Micrarchaeota archaeon]|nr:hypothetical protein [Candidatus Micrarchaeota archaeon]MDE1824581.1 hypothetical protein [Candidatus Micrarchaeota archaeon]MDE1850075.1 hypothetical protein [Candidatus Micrarchaeota archaeon]
MDNSESLRISDSDMEIIYAIGLNEYPTATEFVVAFSYRYSKSASGVWYALKKLKKGGIVDFTEKGEGQKPLGLTEKGMQVLRSEMTTIAPKQQARQLVNAKSSKMVIYG